MNRKRVASVVGRGFLVARLQNCLGSAVLLQSMISRWSVLNPGDSISEHLAEVR